jgi:hypothetical protein
MKKIILISLILIISIITVKSQNCVLRFKASANYSYISNDIYSNEINEDNYSGYGYYIFLPSQYYTESVGENLDFEAIFNLTNIILFKTGYSITHIRYTKKTSILGDIFVFDPNESFNNSVHNYTTPQELYNIKTNNFYLNIPVSFGLNFFKSKINIFCGINANILLVSRQIKKYNSDNSLILNDFIFIDPYSTGIPIGSNNNHINTEGLNKIIF